MGDFFDFRKGVPGGSRVDVMGGPLGFASIDVQVISTSDDDGSIPSAQVIPGPGSWKVSANEVYLIKAEIVLLRASTAQVSMRVVKPDGTEHSKPASWEFEGKAGDVGFATLIVQAI